MTLSRLVVAGLILAIMPVCFSRGAAPPVGALQRPPATAWVAPEDGMVLAWVSVVDSKGNSVPALKRGSFHIFEDDVEQTIEYFGPNSDPISVGIIPCGSIECAEVPRKFLSTTSWADEYFVVVENRSAQRGGLVIQDFTTDIAKLPGVTPSTHSAGVLSVALDYLKEAANPRKVILMIASGLRMQSSGGVSPELVLRRAVKQQDIQIYSITLSRFDEIETLEHENKNKKKQPDPLYAEYMVPALTRATAGRAYYSQFNAAELENVATEIARGLETQYLIGYRSTDPFTDGKWRRIRIEVKATPGTPELTAWTKNGYWAEKGKTPAPASSK